MGFLGIDLLVCIVFFRLCWLQITLFILLILQEANKAPDSWFELKINTHVYVTGLPDDVTAEEVSHDWYLSCLVKFLFARNGFGKYFAGGGGIFQVWDNQSGMLYLSFIYKNWGPGSPFSYDCFCEMKWTSIRPSHH